MDKFSRIPSDGNDETNTSASLSELVRSQNQPGEMHARAHGFKESEEEEAHIDERWLISYADKMTILCGFFIMLFSLSTLDPQKLQEVSDSAQKSFGKPESRVVSPVVAPVPEQASQLKEKWEASQALNRELETKLENARSALSQKLVLEQKVKELTDELKNIQKTQEASKRKTQTGEALSRSLASEFAALQTKTQTMAAENSEKTRSLERLQEKLKKMETSQNIKSYGALIMSWATANHDVDLIVQDPQNHVFDFKHREYPSVPGMLVLDTRQGPGVEVWQSDSLAAGVYQITYAFYNAYGNLAPCPVTGTFFTSKGQFKLPPVELNSKTKRTASFKLSVSEAGEVALLP